MIREYDIKDEDKIIDLWYQASVDSHSFKPESFWEEKKKEVRDKYLPNAETFVYESDGKIAGFISIIHDFIGALFILPEYQNKGIGKELLDFTKQRSDILELDVFKQNKSAVKFYEREGFTIVAENIHEETGLLNLRMRYLK